MKRAYLAAMILLCMGCSNDHHWSSLWGGFGNLNIGQKNTTITISEYKNGRLHIAGNCGDEGDILLVFPATPGDDRIIGSPKCKNGRYEVTTSRFGRPPCTAVVEYNGDKQLRAKIMGTDIYCP